MTNPQNDNPRYPKYDWLFRQFRNKNQGEPNTENTDNNKNDLINIIRWIILIGIILYIIYKLTKKLKKYFRIKKKNSKYKKENTYTDITTTQSIQLDIPPNNMICSYSFDIDVFFQNSSKAIHTILDRTSPIIKVNMMNGSIIIEYLSSKLIEPEPEQESEQEQESGPEEDFTNYNIIEHMTESCKCPSNSSNNNNNNNNDPYPTVLRVVTPPIHFQKNNHIEIKQNIRHITVFLNGKFFYSTTIDYVPYLFKGDATLLPDEAWRYIKLKKVNFNFK